MTPSPDRQAVVKTLAVLSHSFDPVAERLRSEQLLGSLDLHPPGLPPSAILCVRRLRDPRPGSLTLDGRSLTPPSAWQDALTSALESIARSAARPFRGSVPAGAEAVLFSDRSELLACLGTDMIRGEVGTRWWWASLLAERPTARTAFRAWLEAPSYVPGALHLLSERGEAPAFTQALGPGEVFALARAVATSSAAPSLAAAVEGSRANQVAPSNDDAEPWSRWAPEAHAAPLDAPRRALLGITLALHRAPTIARSMAFAAALDAWRERQGEGSPPVDEAQKGGPAHGERPPQAPPPPTPQAHEHVRAAEAAPPAIAERAFSDLDARNAQSAASPDAPAPGDAPPQRDARGREALPACEANSRTITTISPLRSSPPAGPAAPAQNAAKGPPAPPTAAALPKGPPEATQPPPLDAPGHRAGPDAAPPAAFTSPSAAAPDLPPRRPPSPVATRFGGLFFLINLSLYLELYGDFSTPLSPGLELPIYDFLALLGRALLGREIEQDPVWPLLAALAGRSEGEAPGHGFEPPDEWRIRKAWLRPFRDATPWAWALEAGRLSLYHPAGFAVVDLPAEADPEAQARREADAYGEPVALVASDQKAAPAPHTTPLDRWLARLLPYVRARLARALRPVEGEDAGRLLCELPARLHLTATHVDVVMPLAGLPLAVRLAGLDRDAGWVPAAGRHVAFHFTIS